MNRILENVLPVLFAITFVPLAWSQVPPNYQLKNDWLVEGEFRAQIVADENSKTIVMDNGLVRRTISLPLGCTISYDNLMTGETIIRAVQPEGSVTVDGVQRNIGGGTGQPNMAYLTREWLTALRPAKGALKLEGHTVGDPAERLKWKKVRSHETGAVWPPKGKYLRLDYELPASNFSTGTPKQDIKVSVHFELYDNIPVISKWLTVENNTKNSINLDRFNAETLAVVEYVNQVERRDGVDIPRPKVLHVETDMAFGGFTHRNANRHTVKWQKDPAYTTQVNWERQQPCLLRVEPTFGPNQSIPAGRAFTSFRVFELVHDSEDRERRGLALRRMYRRLAPWVTENPLMLHCRSADEQVVRKAIDQAAEVGFEMVILSFGSGFNAENEDPDYLSHWQKLNDYALSKGIHLGSYSLYSSRRIGGGSDIVAPEGMTVIHGNCPAITSAWGQDYLRKLYNLFDTTGFMVFENDGPYPGSVDVTERLPLQKGKHDSRWVHWRIWTDFYKHLRSRGVYMNLPDYYYLSGSNKCGMGYREVNWSLPRAQQLIHTRQNIYDGTWKKTPSMGWMFVPLTEYHGGGKAATIEPLNEHLGHYRMMMLSNLALGVQACYRGPRIYDTAKTKQMVSDVVAWYKKHRAILESDLIHGRRADGRDLDWLLHVNPKLEEKALLSVFNPTDQPLTRTIHVPLYYSGIRGSVRYRICSGQQMTGSLDRHNRVTLKVAVPPNDYLPVVFEE